MKQQVIAMLENLTEFLNNVDAINQHPYSKGIDTTKLIKDLKDYVRDLSESTKKIEEVSVDFIGEPDKNVEENSN